MKCPRCEFVNASDARFCQNCGSPFGLECSTCAVVNSSDARFCKNCGAPLPHSDSAPQAQTPLFSLDNSTHAPPLAMRGERKPVTILFTDIVGSTTYAEKLDPEEWKDIVTGAHRLVSDAVYRNKGTIAQLLGDGVLAFFGAPIAHEDDPLFAVRAALEIQRAMETYRSRLAKRIGNFQMRVGIHSGLVVVDNIGSDAHMEYLAVGDAVNLAARLQSHVEPGAILISEATYRALAQAIECQDCGVIQVKGKAEPIHVYRPLREKSGITHLRVQDHGSELIGRQVELGMLLRASDLLEAGVGRIALISGEPGVGKSRLVSEWKIQTAQEWAQAEALVYGQGLAYRVVMDLVRALVGVNPAMQEVEATNSMDMRAREFLGDGYLERLAYLQNFLGLPLNADAQKFIHALDPRGLQTQYRATVEQLLLAMSERAPVILLCEDIHWADASSVDMLIRLLPLVKRAPILFAFTTRLEPDSAGWKIAQTARDTLGAHVTNVELAPLSAEASRQLASNLLGLDALPAPIQNLVLGKSEGNPLFIQEIIHALTESGALVRQNDEWTLMVNAATLDIPDKLKRLILARIDRLADEPKRALRVASVIGREFFVNILERVLNQVGHSTARPQLVRELDALEFSNLIRLIATRPEIQYLFSHALVQEATYEAILKADRRAVHRAVGEALENAFPERRAELSATLAYHFQNAGEHAKALEYFVTAAERARAQYANAEAIALYQAALNELDAQENPDTARIAELREQLGLIFVMSGRPEEGRAEYQRALELAHDPLTCARLHRLNAVAWMTVRKSDTAIAECDLAERELERAAEADSQAAQNEWLEIQLERGWSLYWQGNVPAMEALNRRMQSEIEAHGSSLQRARFYRNKVSCAYRHDRYVISDVTLQDAKLCYEYGLLSGSPTELAFDHFMYGFTFFWHANLAAAEKEMLENLAYTTKIGDMPNRILCANYLAVIYRMRRDLARVRDYGAQTRDLAMAVGVPFYGEIAKLNLAWADWREGNDAQIEHAALDALKPMGPTHFPAQWLARAPLIALALKGGELETAVAHTRALFDESQNPPVPQLATAYQNALNAWDAGDASRTHILLKNAIRLADELGFL